MERQVEKLSIEQLSSLVNSYPWFVQARVQLARQLVRAGGWSREELSRLLMHVSDPVALRPFVVPLLASQKSISVPPVTDQKPRRIPGGDFFTREEYDKVKRDDDFVFRLGTGSVARKESEGTPADAGQLDFVTETLAQIYADQGYFAQAKEIYEKLILAYPEKSAYFAALIDKFKS
ncbi:MAG: hypothetical protein K5651_06115 [Bacteroidales bacterium]|nr:hypothetical protein [Bacteroidales bacterium]